MKLTRHCFLITAALLTANLSYASTTALKLTNPDQLAWKELPGHPELQYSVLAGNPKKDGIFTVRLKMPKDYQDIVHAHDKTRYDTVISGALYIGFGDKIDRNKTRELTAGGFIACPARIKHFGFTNEETIVQITGEGPWEVLKSSGMNR